MGSKKPDSRRHRRFFLGHRASNLTVRTSRDNLRLDNQRALGVVYSEGSNGMKIIIIISTWLLVAGVNTAFSQVPFYQDKTIAVVLGGPPGGSADLRTRAVTNSWRKHIPGNPTITIQHMGAGGGRQAANHVYRGARPDGLTVGSMGAALVANAILGEPGVQYDIDKFIYLGTPDSAQHYVFVTHREAGLSSIEKLRAASGVRIGAQSVGHPIYITGRLYAYLLGLKEARFVTGYTGPEIDIALFKRELDARATTGDSIVRRSPEWLEKKLVDIHAGIEIPKGQRSEHFANLPDLEKFAQSAKEKKILEMFRAYRLAGQSFFLPPGTPKERVQILQDAMRKTFTDPDFAKEYRKLAGEPPTPLTAEALDKVIKELPRDNEAVELFNKLAGADPLPSR
jgi:tripartite-type tricarboxylate transporter receptor subunit TctC